MDKRRRMCVYMLSRLQIEAHVEGNKTDEGMKLHVRKNEILAEE